MRLGFNWTIGPFEMLEETNKSKKSFELKLSYLDNNLNTLRRIKNNKSNFLKKRNNSANLYYYEPKDYNLVEFVTKANALDGDSMVMLQTASNNNLIIINDSLQFSAGVNLNYVMEYAKEINTGKILAQYPSTANLKSVGLDERGFRRIINTALELVSDQIIDYLKKELVQKC